MLCAIISLRSSLERAPQQRSNPPTRSIYKGLYTVLKLLHYTQPKNNTPPHPITPSLSPYPTAPSCPTLYYLAALIPQSVQRAASAATPSLHVSYPTQRIVHISTASPSSRCPGSYVCCMSRRPNCAAQLYRAISGCCIGIAVINTC